MAKTKGALKILDRVTGNSDSIKAGIAAARANLEVAQMIYDARTKAGPSQSELAALIGSKQPVIARLGRSNNAWNCDSSRRNAAGHPGARRRLLVALTENYSPPAHRLLPCS